MTLSPIEWHDRFRQQASWTRQVRQYMLERLALESSARILEVGCGTGAVLAGFIENTPAALHGLDINVSYLGLARQHTPGVHLTAGDALRLPYLAGSFAAAACHFLLLWVHDPNQVVGEMARVVRPGGAVLLMAEPDYGGRVDYPHELGILGQWQRESLSWQGANPDIGRRLASLLYQAGLREIESGVLGGSWMGPPSKTAWEMEWKVLCADLEYLPGVWPDRQAEIDALQEMDRLAWERGERVLFVPTFYSWGIKPP